MKTTDIGRISMNITALSLLFNSNRHHEQSTTYNGQQIYRIFSLLVNIKKDFSKQFNNNQQYFWSNYQQSTSKIMAKSTINKKVCTPSSNLHNTSKTSGNLLWNIWVSTSIFIHQNKIIPALKQNLLQDHSQTGVNSNKL